MRSGSQGGKTSRSSGSTMAVTPRSAARRRRPSCGSTTVMSEMPMSVRAATLNAPIGPAPKTMTRSPGATPDRVMPCKATERGSASAAWRGERPSGRRRTPAARHRMYSAKAPSDCSPVMLWRFSHCEGLPSRQRRQVPQRWPGPPTTSSPTDQPVTSSPTAAIVPLHSWPATAPGVNPQPSRS